MLSLTIISEELRRAYKLRCDTANEFSEVDGVYHRIKPRSFYRLSTRSGLQIKERFTLKHGEDIPGIYGQGKESCFTKLNGSIKSITEQEMVKLLEQLNKKYIQDQIIVIGHSS